MADFVAEILDQPARRAASAIALAYLDDAVSAAARLSDRTDHEALHDFRVALRRLRVTVRAYAGLHESVPKKQRRRLRKLVRATNAARDAEVQVAWFRDRSARFTRAQRAALAAVRARLRARRRQELAHAEDGLQQQFAKIERKLRRRLTVLQRDAGAHEAPFRAVAAATLVQHGNELSARLATASTDPAELHATRIAAKRLRYLLEPAVPGLLDGNGMLDRLKTLQDLFGALTDAHELEVQLLEAGAAVVPALSLLHEESAALFGTLREEGTAAGPALKRQLEAAVRRLRPAVATPPSLRQRGRRPRGAAAVS